MRFLAKCADLGRMSKRAGLRIAPFIRCMEEEKLVDDRTKPAGRLFSNIDLGYLPRRATRFICPGLGSGSR